MANKYDFRILIIDDNLEVHSDFMKILTTVKSSSKLASMDTEMFGKVHPVATRYLPSFQIDTALQGKEGLEKVRVALKDNNPYALAFVDVRMPPGWDGIETIKHIWELDKNMQVVICTAYSDYTWEETIAELGQTDNLLILKKPFDTIAVRQLASALTRKWKLMQESQKYTQSLESTIQERTKELQHQATHDILTGLPNRILLEDRISQAIVESERNKDAFAIIFFDLDRFKLINDSLGHAAGDELLRVVSTRIQESMRKANTIARVGGDEFIIIIKDLDQPEYLIRIGINLLKTINQPLKLEEREIVPSASMGICLFPKDGRKMNELIHNADTAMYRAKELGGNQFHFYTSEMNEDSIHALEMETELRHALANNEFFLEYQPQIELKDNRLVAVEALIRWNHPKRGVLLPIDFIPAAETTGLIVPIGEWIIKQACTENKRWQEDGLTPIRVAVNVTIQQLRQIEFTAFISDILKKTALDPKYLEIELSESAIINNTIAIKIITALKKIGVLITVDEFGIGFTSLHYLKKIQLDRLKIDRSFVQNIFINSGDEVVIQAIIAMARGLNIEVIAEGVETEKQLNYLKSKKCNEIQGVYFSQPLSTQEMVDLLGNRKKITEMILPK